MAKAYRLLKAIPNTARDDGVIKRNPCRIKGAGREKSPERPTLTIAQAYGLAEAIGQRYRALVLLAMFSSLRWGELGALRRCDAGLAARTVRDSRQLAEARGGGSAFGRQSRGRHASSAARRRHLYQRQGQPSCR